MNTTVTKRSKNANIAIMAMFTAIIIIMAFTPFGMIQLPLIKATIIHIPVIIGGILMGQWVAFISDHFLDLLVLFLTHLHQVPFHSHFHHLLPFREQVQEAH